MQRGAKSWRCGPGIGGGGGTGPLARGDRRDPAALGALDGRNDQVEPDLGGAEDTPTDLAHVSVPFQAPFLTAGNLQASLQDRAPYSRPLNAGHAQDRIATPPPGRGVES